MASRTKGKTRTGLNFGGGKMEMFSPGAKDNTNMVTMTWAKGGNSVQLAYTRDKAISAYTDIGYLWQALIGYSRWDCEGKSDKLA